jgi:GNAT superfamily N-acetyltransferase
MSRIHIEFLADFPGCLSTLAAWHYDEWGKSDPALTLEHFETGLRQRMNRKQLPLALVTYSGDVPVATASIKIQEMETHPQYMHWLGAVYTIPDYRRRGIGSQTIEAVAALAKLLGVEQLYLYTHQNEALYAHLAWVTIERPLYRGREVVIMRRSL